MFSIEQRERVHERLVQMGHDDPRVIAGAVVGSLADGPGDRWSDLDLTFGLAADASLAGVLADWTAALEREFGAVRLFDLPFLSSVYRVFMFPGSLQVDVSFTPGHEFGALGPRFRLLFGHAVARAEIPAPVAEHLLGLAAHHAVRGRICIERGRPWQAEYWISSTRDEALALACLRHGLESRHARGADALPEHEATPFRDALPRSLERAELLRAHAATALLLRREASALGAFGANIERVLGDLAGKEAAKPAFDH